MVELPNPPPIAPVPCQYREVNHPATHLGKLGQIGFLQIFDEAIRISRKTGKVGLFPKTDRVLPYSVQHSVQLWKTPL